MDLLTTAQRETQLELSDPSQKEARDIFVGMVARELKVPRIAMMWSGVLSNSSNGSKARNSRLKVYPSQNIHAKLYVMTFKEDDRDTGRVITGSSNLN